MGYTKRLINGEDMFECQGCEAIMWDEGDMIEHVARQHASVGDRMEQAGRDIRDLHERMDKVFATLNSGKSAIEAAYQKGRREARSEAYDELMNMGRREALYEAYDELMKAGRVESARAVLEMIVCL